MGTNVHLNGHMYNSDSFKGYGYKMLFPLPILEDMLIELGKNSSGVGRKSVRVATTGTQITLSGLQVIDGIQLSDGDRVLVKDQLFATSQNGLYVSRVGAWERAGDFDETQDVIKTLFVVEEGTSNKNTIWLHTTTSPVTLGVTPITFQQVLSLNDNNVLNMPQTTVVNKIQHISDILQVATDAIYTNYVDKKVGIGTTTPTKRLYVKTSEAAEEGIHVENTSTNSAATAGVYMACYGQTGKIYMTNSSHTNLPSRLVISSNAAYGIYLKGLSFHIDCNTQLGNPLGVGFLGVKGAPSYHKKFGFFTNSGGFDMERWSFQSNNEAETGGDNGSNFEMWRCSDSGAVLGTVLKINRSSGRIRIGDNNTPSELLDVAGNVKAVEFRLSALNTAPASSSAPGGAGEIRITSDYIYVCVAGNTWKRAALTSW